MIVEGPDGREYGTAAAIGERLVALGHANGPGLIRHWASSGQLVARGNAGRSPIYSVDDVMMVERSTRKRAASRGGRRRTPA